MSDYEIGYKKPPLHSRFKKGQKANPRGRPKGAKGLVSSLQKIFDKSVSVREEGKAKKISVTEAVGLRLVEKALQGDPRAIREFMTLQQRYEDKHPPEAQDAKNVKVVFTWADPFDPEREDLSYLSDQEIRFLKHLMDKREAHQRNKTYTNDYGELHFHSAEEIRQIVHGTREKLEKYM